MIHYLQWSFNCKRKKISKTQLITKIESRDGAYKNERNVKRDSLLKKTKTILKIALKCKYFVSYSHFFISNTRKHVYCTNF